MLTIPPPLDPDDFEVVVDLADEHLQPHGVGHTCASFLDRSTVLSDVVVAMSPRWLAWAVSEAIAGRTPRTKAYLSPVLSGGGFLDLGHGPVARPMVFGGATCRPAWPDGQMCDHAEPDRLPLHEALLPAARRVLGQSGTALVDDFDDGLSWPLVVVEEASA